MLADVGRYPIRPRAESIVSINSLDDPASKKLTDKIFASQHNSAWLCTFTTVQKTCITSFEAAQARTGSNRAVPSPCTSTKACIVYSAHSTTTKRHCRQSGKTMRASNQDQSFPGSISLLLIGYTSAHEIHLVQTRGPCLGTAKQGTVLHSRMQAHK